MKSQKVLLLGSAQESIDNPSLNGMLFWNYFFEESEMTLQLIPP